MISPEPTLHKIRVVLLSIRVSVAVGLLLSSVACVTGPTYLNRPPDVSVMSFNIWYDYENRWELRKAVLFEYLNAVDPDIVGLQEVVSAIPEYFLEINRPLDWLEDNFADRYDIVGTEAFSPLLVRRDGYTVIDSGVYWLSLTPDIPWSNHWEHIVPTSVTWAHIESSRTGHTFLVKNTHLGVRNPAGRRKSVELIYSRTPDNIPVIIMGDFNETPNRFVPRFLRNRGFADSHRGKGGSFRVFSNREFAPYRIDYIMVRGLQVIESRIDTPRSEEIFVSDHNALVAYLAFGYMPPIGPAPPGHFPD